MQINLYLEDYKIFGTEVQNNKDEKSLQIDYFLIFKKDMEEYKPCEEK